MQSNRRTEMKLIPLIFGILLLALLSVFIRFNINSIPPAASNVSEEQFSAGRAFDVLNDLLSKGQPHPVDSRANDKVREGIIARLQALKFEPSVQKTTICNDSTKGYVRCTLVQNIIVHIPGTESDSSILLSAHYDSVPTSPGASDAGAAVATLLEVARLIQQQSQTKNSIVLLFNEGEEFGLFGAKAFMQKHPLAKKVKVALNVEARGSQGQSVMFETGEDSGWLVKAYAQSTPSPLTSSLFYEVYRFLPNDTDLTVYKKFGLQGLNFAHAEQEPHYHTPLDNLSTLDLGSLQHHGDNIWGVLNHIKNTELSAVEQGNLVFTDILGSGMVYWSADWTFWFVSLLWIGLIMIVIAALRDNSVKVPELFIGFLAQTILLLVCATGAWLLQWVVSNLGESKTPWRAFALPMQVALWFGLLSLSLVVLRPLARNHRPIGLVLGIIISWLLIASILSFTLTGISFLFILPAAISLLLLGVMLALKSTKEAWLLGLVLLLIIATAGLFFIPIAYVLTIMVGYNLAIAIGIILSFVLVTLLPLLSGSSPNQSRIFSKKRLTFSHWVVGFFLVSITATGWTIFQPAYSAWTPQPLNLLYVTDRENQQTQLVVSGDFAPFNQALMEKYASFKQASVLPWSSRKFWSVNLSQAESAKRNRENLKRIESATLIEKNAVMTEVETIQSEDNQTIVNLNINTLSKGLNDLVIYIPIANQLQSIETHHGVFNYNEESSRFKDYYQFHCRGRHCHKMMATFKFSKRELADLILVEIRQDFPTIHEALNQLRGENATPRHNGDQSLFLTRISLSTQ